MNEAAPPPAEGINPGELEILIAEGNIPDIPAIDANQFENNARNLLINNYFFNL
jgi:hypothetical protein